MEFKTLNGYGVKDEIARKAIEQMKTETAENIAAMSESMAAADLAIMAQVESVAGKIPSYFMTATQRIYIDCVNGNDENDGLTMETPIRTLEKWGERFSEGYVDNRCYLMTAGVYTLTHKTLMSASTHITGLVDGCIIDVVDTADELVFYGIHHNLKKITLRATGREIRFETCSVFFDNVIFDCDSLVFFGCYAECKENVTVPRTYLYGTNGRIRNITCTCTDTTASAIYVERGSNVRLYGEITFPDLPEANEWNAFYFNCSVVYCTWNSIIGSGWAKGIKTESSLIFLSNDRHDDLKGLATTPLSVSSSMPSVFVNSDMYTGGAYE